MKVVYLNTYDNKGGAALACYRLYEAMAKSNTIFPSFLVNKKYSNDSQIVSLSDTKLNNMISDSRFALEKFFFLFAEQSKAVRFDFSTASLGADISEHPLIREADIVHIHWINQGFLSLKSVEKLAVLNKPIVWTLHDMWPMTGGCHNSGRCHRYKNQCGRCPFLAKPSPKDLSHRIWSRKNEIYQKLNLSIVTPSQWMAENVKASSLLQKNQLQRIPNTLDTNIFYPSDKKDARDKLDLCQNSYYLAFIAQIPSKPNKGFYYLKKGLEILASENPSLREQIELLVIGNVKDDILSHFPFSVRSSGYITDTKKMADYYRAAHLFILPSLEENLPNTIMEAMACGTPSVAFNVGGIPEMIDHKRTGYLAEYKSSADLANGVRWHMDQDKGQDKPFNNALAKFNSAFHPEIIARHHKDLYHSIIDK